MWKQDYVCTAKPLECLVHTLVACPHSGPCKSNPSLLAMKYENCAPGVTAVLQTEGGGSFCSPQNTVKDTDQKKWTRTSVWKTRLKNGSEVLCHYWVWHKGGCSSTDWQGQWLWTSLLRVLLLPLLWRCSWLLRWLWACNINTNETYECNKMQISYFACSGGDLKLKCHLQGNGLHLQEPTM